MANETNNDPKLNEKIISDFHHLRNEQRNLVNNLSTLEMDLKEHKTVIETLKSVSPDRKCFRLIGGVLCERTVQDILPQLIENKDFIESTIKKVNEDITEKGLEINRFKEENNIQIRGEQISEQKSQPDNETSINRNVLVSD